jgi:ATP-dependent exoDNAse (exonuclease V) beta subunit
VPTTSDAASQPAPFAAAESVAAPAPPAADFSPVADGAARARRAVTAPPNRPAGRAAAARGGSREDGILLGRVVHRLFQAGVRGDLAPPALSALARRLVPDEDAGTEGDLERLIADAARVFAGVWSNEDFQAAVDGAACYYEVPVSSLPAPGRSGAGAGILRGAIDCLAYRPDGRVIVVEFKTGARRAGHRRQLQAYVDAVRAMHPGAPVEGRLIYPS